jgi:hypothetical protein
VNAAFVLVTTAWLAGADAPGAAAPEKPAPAVAASSCSGGCNACCEEGLWTKLKNRLHSSHDCCDSCPKPCPKACPKPCPKPEPVCDPCKESTHDKLKARLHRGHDSCDTCGKPAPAIQGHASACCEDSCGPNGLQRFGARLRSHSHDGCCSGCGATIDGPKGEKILPPKGGDPIKKLPEGGKEVRLSPVQEVIPVSAKSEEGPKSPFELSHRNESRVDHATDYSWLTGQLFYVHADGGLWILRYAPLSKEDANGGGVVLARDISMESYREGDLVTIHGQLLGQKSSIYLGGPLYQAKSIELVDRKK